MAGGRPTKYNDQTVPKAEYYLLNFESIGDQIPSIAGLADYLELTRETIHAWVRDDLDEAFSDIISRILQRQEKTLANKGLSGDFNSTITKLILGKHGYHDKVDQELAGPGGGAVPIQYVVQPVRPVKPEEPEGGTDE